MKDNSLNYSWDELRDDYGEQCVFRDNSYHVIEPIKAYKPCHEHSATVGNFTFQVKMKLLSGRCGGISFGEQANQHGRANAFLVCSDGTYRIVTYENLATASSTSGPSALINQGLNSENILAVVQYCQVPEILNTTVRINKGQKATRDQEQTDQENSSLTPHVVGNDYKN